MIVIDTEMSDTTIVDVIKVEDIYIYINVLLENVVHYLVHATCVCW